MDHVPRWAKYDIMCMLIHVHGDIRTIQMYAPYHMLRDSKTDEMLYFGIETLHGSGKASKISLLSISSILNFKVIRIDTLYVIQ